MLTTIRYILLTALRDRLFVALIAGLIFSTLVSATLGGTAFLEENAMTLSYAAASARIILVVGVIVFVCFHIRNAFDTKEIDVILSRPISRSALVLAYWAGFMQVALLLTVPVILVLGLIGPENMQGYYAWAGSLMLEMGIVVAIALFSALTLRSAVTSVLACMGFYTLSRMMAFFVIAAQNSTSSGLEYVWMGYVLSGISTLVPRLDFFSKTEWLIYGTDSFGDIGWYVLQAAIFIPLLIYASMIDFRRKQF